MAGVESKAAPAPSEKTAEERFQQVGEQVFDLLKREDDLVHKQDVIKICNGALWLVASSSWWVQRQGSGTVIQRQSSPCWMVFRKAAVIWSSSYL